MNISDISITWFLYGLLPLAGGMLD